jgi:hypothetical protein
MDWLTIFALVVLLVYTLLPAPAANDPQEEIFPD